ncbi:MAG: DUF3326 domain-containing protein [bacterium]|nr:DUF3326 domain-containing protein [bacterium]
MSKNKDYSIFIVPTGIGANIGGFAGDAGAFARKISKEFPLIVNPNVVNAACFSAITENMLYTEGYTITEFLKGNISLIPSKDNKIGVIFDKAISQDVLNIHINTINAVKTVYGINVIGWEISDEKVGVDFFTTESGISTGGVKNTKTLIEAGKKLLARGANVLAVVCKFDEPEEDGYADGECVDVVGGAEAIISHCLTKELGVPTVHAPAFEDYAIKPDIVHPKAAAEYITPTFLPCLLLGLQNAPLIKKGLDEKYITVNNVKTLIMPKNSLGSSIVTNAIEKGIIVLSVEENSTVLNVTAENLGISDKVISVKNYEECLNFLRRLK